LRLDASLNTTFRPLFPHLFPSPKKFGPFQVQLVVVRTLASSASSLTIRQYSQEPSPLSSAPCFFACEAESLKPVSPQTTHVPEHHSLIDTFAHAFKTLPILPKNFLCLISFANFFFKAFFSRLSLVDLSWNPSAPVFALSLS
jgi:hypothetical protein